MAVLYPLAMTDLEKNDALLIHKTAMTTPQALDSDRGSEDDESGGLLGKHGTSQRDPSLRSPARAWTRIAVTPAGIYVAAVHLLLVAMAALLWKEYMSDAHSISLSGQSWSPVEGLVEYEVRTLHDHHSIYAGRPRPESDAAWKELTRATYFNATKPELQRARASLANLTEWMSGGYPAALGVYHELHCIHHLRYYLYRDHYYTNLTASQEEYLKGHLDHCLDSLRSTIMCHGNTGVYSFNWNEPANLKPGAQSRSKALCVKWDSIHRWAAPRGVPEEEELRRVAPVADGRRRDEGWK